MQARGGYQLYVEGNASGGLSAEDLRSRTDVAGVARSSWCDRGRSDETVDEVFDWWATGITDASCRRPTAP